MVVLPRDRELQRGASRRPIRRMLSARHPHRRASRATSRRRRSGRRASPRGTRRTPTARARSCSATRAPGRSRRTGGSAVHRALAAGGRRAGAYALEGSVFIAGAAVQWLRDGLRRHRCRRGRRATRVRRRRTTRGCTSCPRSSASVRRGGTRLPGACSSASRGARACRTSRARPSTRSPTRCATSLAGMDADAGGPAVRAARGRRRGAQRRPAPVPGRPPRRARRATRRDRDDRRGCGVPGGHRRRRLVGPGRGGRDLGLDRRFEPAHDGAASASDCVARLACGRSSAASAGRSSRADAGRSLGVGVERRSR